MFHLIRENMCVEDVAAVFVYNGSGVVKAALKMKSQLIFGENVARIVKLSSRK